MVLERQGLWLSAKKCNNGFELTEDWARRAQSLELSKSLLARTENKRRNPAQGRVLCLMMSRDR